MIYIVAFFMVRYVYIVSPEDVVNWLGALAIIQVILIMPPLTYIYEQVLGRSVTDKEERRLAPIMRRILDKTGSKITPRVMVLDSYDPNMAAFNKNTLIVNKVCLKTFNDDELAGILCHELGHLQYRHSGNLLVHYINDMFVKVFITVVRVVYQVLSELAGQSWLLSIFVWPLIAGIFIFLVAPVWLAAFIMNVAAAAVSRQGEYQADDYANSHGFGPGLISALTKLEHFEKEPENWWEKVKDTHPPMAHRIDRLETT